MHLDVKVILDGARYELHDKIIRLRNKAVAHAEWEFYPTSQIPVPAATTAGFATTGKRWHPVNEAIDLDMFRDIALKMQKGCLDELFRSTRLE